MIPDLSTVAKLSEYLDAHPPESAADFAAFKAVLFHLKAKERAFMDLATLVLDLTKRIAAAPQTPADEAVIESRDRTPFPAGAVAATAVPINAEPGNEEVTIPIPDTGSGPAMNAAPIPARAKNGSKSVPQ
jgi:hypothetical protein